MKRTISTLLCVIFLFSLVPNPAFADNENKTVKGALFGIEFNVPQSWIKLSSSQTELNYCVSLFPRADAKVSFLASAVDENHSLEEIEEHFIDELSKLDDYEDISSDVLSLDGETGIYFAFLASSENHLFLFYTYLFFLNSDVLLFEFSISNDASDSIKEQFIKSAKNVVDSLDFSLYRENENAIMDNTPLPVASTPAPTAGETNALREALQYLKYSAFSYEGLIEQLEYEGYTHDQCVYAVNHCGADWNEQALQSAKNYLKYSAFSYTGLIDQLEYIGFAYGQALYAASNCGADWFEQAALAAENYLKYSAFSRSRLIEQLEYSGFTHEQAVFGANQNGL